MWIIGGGVVLLLVVAIFLYNNASPYSAMKAGSGSFSVGVSVPSAASMPEAAMDMVVQNARDMEERAVMVDGDDGVTRGGEVEFLEEGERLIVKNGTLSMVVGDVVAAIDRIGTYIEERGGFVVMSNVEKRTVAPIGTITVRIPVERFDVGFEEIQTFGDVEQRRVDGRDITEEYVDLEAQLNNLRATEEQFLSILNRAVRIEDVLAVQRELTWVRERIERIEGRMNYLRESADMSSITIHLSTDPSELPVVNEEDKWRPLGVVRDAARSLVDMGKALASAIIWLVIYTPLWIVLGGIIWLVIWLVRKKSKK
jgi:hypothetical protein